MDRKFGLIALGFILLAIIGIAMVETVAAAKYCLIIRVLDNAGSPVSNAHVYDNFAIDGYTNSRGLLNIVGKLSGSLGYTRFCAEYKYRNGKTAKGSVTKYLNGKCSGDYIQIKLGKPK